MAKKNRNGHFHCVSCREDEIPNKECYPVATCGCSVCEDIIADEEGYPLYREEEMMNNREWKWDY